MEFSTGLKKRVRSHNLLLVCFSLSLLLMHSLHPFSQILPGVDSSSFMYIGKKLHEGILPYRDLFDHKGPLLYVINTIGMSVGSGLGVWLIGWISMMVAVSFSYRAACVFFTRQVALLTVVVSFLLLALCYDGGNFVEEYALPFMAISLYLFSKHYKNGQSFLRSAGIVGASMACVLMLRPNMIMLWFCFGAHILWREWRLGRGKKAWQYIAGFVTGAGVIVMILCIPIIVLGLWDDFIRAYFSFNVSYTLGGDLHQFMEALRHFYSFFYTIPVAIVSCIVWILRHRGQRKLGDYIAVPILGSLLLTLIIISLPGRLYAHYMMVIIPLLVLPLGFVLNSTVKVFRTVTYKNRVWERVGFLILFVSITGSLIIAQGTQIIRTFYKDSYTADLYTLSEYINEETKEDDRIISLDYGAMIYLLSDREPASRFFYAGYKMDYEILIEDLCENEPAYIMGRVFPYSVIEALLQKGLIYERVDNISSSYVMYRRTQS